MEAKHLFADQPIEKSAYSRELKCLTDELLSVLPVCNKDTTKPPTNNMQQGNKKASSVHFELKDLLIDKHSCFSSSVILLSR